MGVIPDDGRPFDLDVDVAVVGAGACGLTAALAAAEAGADVLVLERDAIPYGLTGMSTGQIPAAGTRFQRAKGIEDGPDLLAADLLAATAGQTDPAIVQAVAALAGPTVEWLADRTGLAFDVVDNFRYPGHSRLRMHGTPNRRGEELLGALLAAVAAAGVPLATEARVTDLVVRDGDRVRGLVVERPGGRRERIGVGALVLACNGFGADRDLLRRHLPEMAEVLYFGHPGNAGDALRWGEALGAGLADLGSYQGHASIAAGHGVQITWATMTEGGVQVNLSGRRFADESRGYSEHTADVARQPGGAVWSIFDQRIHAIASQIDDYREATKSGAIIEADTVEVLAARTGLPVAALAATLADIDRLAASSGTDAFGRTFQPSNRLAPPYRAVKVVGALLMTQGGLVVDAGARVRKVDGGRFPNLFAGGGAARGLAGPGGWGYLSGAGLLSAVTLGRAAGHAAGAQSVSERSALAGPFAN